VYIHTPYNNRQQMCQVWSQSSTQYLIDTHIYYGGSTIYCNNTPGNNGNITEVKDWKIPANTRNFGYDSLNRITSFSNGATGQDAMQQSYTYDSFGNLSQSGTLNSQLTFGTNNQINSGGYAYDVAGNLNSVNNGAFTSTYSFDAESKMFTNSAGEYYTYDANDERMRKDSDGTYTEYQYLNGQPIAEKHADGSWSDYIYANGQKIARADSYDARIHVSGVTPGGKIASWQVGGGAGYIIQPNDKLMLRQFDSNGFGGPNIQFTDGTQTYGALADSAGQTLSALQTQGQWVNRVADLSAYAGKTISDYQVVSDRSSPAGSYDIYLSDIAIVSSESSVTPIYNRQTGSTFPNVYNEGQTNLNAFEETSNQLGDSVQGITTTTYYVGDQIGSTRMEASAGGWPVSSDTFYPFGQEQTATTDPNHYKFAGLERDTESNLDHAMYRQYAYGQGRWMSPDPYNGSYDLANPQSFNRYAYVGNSPLGLTDLSGLYTCSNCSDGGGLTGILATIFVDGFESLFHLFEDSSYKPIGQGRPNGTMMAPGTYDDPGASDPESAYLYVPWQWDGQNVYQFDVLGVSVAPSGGTISPLSRANCASSVADDEYSIAAHTSGALPDNGFVKAFLGNGVSGAYNILNNDSLGEAAKDLVLGGANQGIPGGNAINKGVVGVATDLIVGGVGANATKAGVDALGGYVGWGKFFWDAGSFAYAYVIACR
jgi:RHS repeat-associated protein